MSKTVEFFLVATTVFVVSVLLGAAGWSFGERLALLLPCGVVAGVVSGVIRGGGLSLYP